ncbi:helix-turn-helix transcriptional regulator [Mycobacterium sp. M26]|uniref:helix-turn-helix domain-containing protein n=1 Tax=Mycobacterium sp. M26 TaxID=1762962 RepID=UPI0009EB88FE|nr:helix-turn-helix transcriptional regulator [Mycobacterium sp. M26]
MQNEAAPADTELWAIAADRFGKRVKTQREGAGWSQRELSEKLAELGVKLDTSAITRIENGSRDPRLREATAIAHALGVSLKELLNFDDNPLGALYSACTDLENATSRLRDALGTAADSVDHLQSVLIRSDVRKAVAGQYSRVDIDYVIDLCTNAIDQIEEYDFTRLMRMISKEVRDIDDPYIHVGGDDASDS